MYQVMSNNNAKVLKNIEYGWETAILHFLPSDESGWNFCPSATEGCTNGCLNRTGNGGYPTVQDARFRRSFEYMTDRKAFLEKLDSDIAKLLRRCEKTGLNPCVRINGTSDIPSLAMKLARKWSDVQFYDYTAVYKTLWLDKPENYYVTFSRKENNEEQCLKALENGFNVSVVFDKLPETMRFWELEVIDGTQHDLRFLDPTPIIVGLLASGKARGDDTGFVVRNAE